MASLSYYFVEPGSWTWNQIWAKFDDPLEECPKSHEVWQYMGSVKEPGKLARHEFRHRHHPVTKARAFRYVHGPHDSGSWTVTTKNTIADISVKGDTCYSNAYRRE